MTVPLHRPLTAEEFEAAPGFDGYELIDGTPREKVMGNEADFTGHEIAFHLSAAARASGAGRVYGPESGYVCFPHRPRLVRKPDVSFVARGRYPDDRPPRGYARLAPDLAAEVVSPNDTYEEVDEKVDDYRRAGVPVIWVVSPATRAVHVYLADGTVRRLTADDELTADPVVPGFRVLVADLFPVPPADPPAAP